MKKYFSFRNIWLVIFISTGIGLSISFGDSLLGFVAFISGMLCVFAAAIGSRHTFSIGVVNTITYSIVSYNAGLNGEVMLNACYYFPLQFVGWYMWSKNRQSDGLVIKKTLKLLPIISIFVGASVATYLYGLFLATIEGQAIPMVDSFTTVFSIIASVLMLLRYREYWLLYILVNAVSVFMWTHRLASGVPDSATMVVLWSAFLVNSMYGAYVWYKGTK